MYWTSVDSLPLFLCFPCLLSPSLSLVRTPQQRGDCRVWRTTPMMQWQRIPRKEAELTSCHDDARRMLAFIVSLASLELQCLACCCNRTRASCVPSPAAVRPLYHARDIFTLVLHWKTHVISSPSRGSAVQSPTARLDSWTNNGRQREQ